MPTDFQKLLDARGGIVIKNLLKAKAIDKASQSNFTVYPDGLGQVTKAILNLCSDAKELQAGILD